MTYGAPVDTGAHNYTLAFTHNATGITFNCEMITTGSNATDAQKDQIFQALVNQVAALSGVIINGATKSGGWVSTVTSP